MGGEIHQTTRASASPLARRACVQYQFSVNSNVRQFGRSDQAPPGGSGRMNGEQRVAFSPVVVTPCSVHPTRIPTGQSQITGCVTRGDRASGCPVNSDQSWSVRSVPCGRAIDHIRSGPTRCLRDRSRLRRRPRASPLASRLNLARRGGWCIAEPPSIGANFDAVDAVEASTNSPSMTTPIIPSRTSSRPMRRSTVSGQRALVPFDCAAVEGCELRRCLAFMLSSFPVVRVTCVCRERQNYRPRSTRRPVPETGHALGRRLPISHAR